jgi:hypothetical protein
VPLTLTGDNARRPLREHRRGTMLVMSRRKNESIVISDRITITVIRLR